VRTDGSLQPTPDTLHLQVGSPDGGVTYGGGDYAMVDTPVAPSGAYAFPVTFAIDSNGDPSASVSIVVSVSGGAEVLETQRYVIDAVPIDDVAQLDVVLRASCASQAAGDGGAGASCCPPECAWADATCSCSAGVLPAYPSDAGAPASSPVPLAEAGARDATTDGDLDAGEATDASCEAGAFQCLDFDTLQQCTTAGQWEAAQKGCTPGFTYCFQGSCVPAPPSCLGADYGACESDPVPGGTFVRGEDPLHEDAGAPAALSSFRLDAYEVVVWRFRAFVNALVLPGTSLPDAGAGTHGYLAEGKGLNGGSDGGAYETGWDPAWNAMFPPPGGGTSSMTQWTANLGCNSLAATWSVKPSAHDESPINCVDWYEAYAFCIWDGGFLPSEAEWNYAAAGGAAQRLYPWGSTDPGSGSDYAIYGCLYPQLVEQCTTATVADIAPIGEPLMGYGLFGQANLAGNVAEWTLDSYEPTYPTPCTDCAGLAAGTQRIFRGGSFDRGIEQLYTSSRVPADPTQRFRDVGFRCARAPLP
jgi:formylglycine-generating enzyme